MLEEVKKDAAERMAKCVAAYRHELKRLRTGRASASLVDHIRVDYYGAESPLNQVANVAVEDSRTLTIVPYDKQMVAVIEKANKAIKQIAEADKFDLILQDVVWVSPRLDITDRVIKALAEGK